MPDPGRQDWPEHVAVERLENSRMVLLGRISRWIAWAQKTPNLDDAVLEHFNDFEFEACSAESLFALDATYARFLSFSDRFKDGIWRY